MTISDLLQLLLWLLGGLLAVIGRLLPGAFDKRQSLPGKCFIFGLGVACGTLFVFFSKLISTPQVQQSAAWIRQVYWTLGIGYGFSVPAIAYLFHAGRDRKTDSSDDATPTAVPTTILQAPEDWRRELLKILETDVNQRLDYSLPNGVSVPQPATEQENEFPQPIALTPDLAFLRQCLQPQRSLKVFGDVETPLHPDAKAIDIFDRDDIQGRLLIIGAIGGGKTTTLLQLARDLIARAQQQPEQPIPVIFELADWHDDEQSLADWLADDLRLRNNIPEAITQEWIKTGQLLPLLDGLDEAGSTRRARYVEKINAYLQTDAEPSQIVICCRHEEHIKNLAIAQKVKGAVRLHPLTEVQIENYLILLNVGHLWQAIANDSEGLLELAKTPLLLPLIPIAYPQGIKRLSSHFSNPKRRLQYQEKCRQELFDAYILRRLEENEDDKGYSKEKTLRWLVWLAKTLKRQIQTEFAIEKMQLDLLETSTQKLVYWLLISFTIGGIIGLVVAQIGYLFFAGLFGDIFGSVFRDIFGFGSGIICGLFLGFNYTFNNAIDPNEITSLSWQKVLDSLIRGLRGATIGGLVGGAIFGLLGELFFGLMVGIFFGLIFETVFNLIFGLSIDEIKTRNQPNQGVKTSLKNLAIISSISFPGCVLAFVLPSLAVKQTVEPLSALIVGLGLALFLGINFGGLACLQHSLLRLILWRSGVIPWNYARFLSYASERRLIQPVGGRYRFIHNLLRDRLAKVPDL